MLSYDLDELGFMSKYENIKQLIDTEVTPLLDILLKLSNITNNFSSTANRIANIDIRQTHEIKEFLELTFDARKLAQKVEDAVEFRTEAAVQAAECCYYEIISGNKKKEGSDKDIDGIIAAGNSIVNKNIVKKGSEKNSDKKDEKKDTKDKEQHENGKGSDEEGSKKNEKNKDEKKADNPSKPEKEEDGKVPDKK